MIVFTSCGVRFCASSTMMNWFGIERPRMYVSGSISRMPRSSSSWYPRPAFFSERERFMRYSTLSKIGCIQGFSFSSTEPGR